MKSILVVILFGVTAVAAAANHAQLAAAPAPIDDRVVNARIDARQNELMRALLTARLRTASARAQR